MKRVKTAVLYIYYTNTVAKVCSHSILWEERHIELYSLSVWSYDCKTADICPYNACTCNVFFILIKRKDKISRKSVIKHVIIWTILKVEVDFHKLDHIKLVFNGHTLWQKKSWKDKENTLSRGCSITDGGTPNPQCLLVSLFWFTTQPNQHLFYFSTSTLLSIPLNRHSLGSFNFFFIRV